MHPDTRKGLDTYRGLVFALALGGALRLFHAAGVSLHLDDFHSLFHARHLTSGGFWAGLVRDNHPPLSFLALGGVRWLGGEAPLVLRLPNLIYGLATIALTWRLARHLPGRHTRDLAALGVALSSLHIELTTDLRMYGLLSLATVGLLDALVHSLERSDERGAGWVAVSLWILVGAHSHYHFLYVLALLGPLSLLIVAREPTLRGRLRPLSLSYLAAAALALPWFAWGFPEQLAHRLAPGGSEISLKTLAEGYAHLMFFRVSLAGEPLRSVLIGASGIALLCACTGCVLLFARPDPDAARRRRLALLLGACAFCIPACSALAAYLVPRAGFEWRYLAPAIAPFVVLFAAGATRKLLRALALTVLVAAAINAVLLVGAPGREDYAQAVEYVISEREPDEAVLAVDWQPGIFPHGVGWNFYARRTLAPGAPLGPVLEHTDDFALTDPEALQRYERVFCILRTVPDPMPFLTELRSEFENEEVVAFGQAIFVLTFSRAR